MGYKTDSNLPSQQQRETTRGQPQSPVIMYQQWRNLLFLHWEYSADAIQATLPDGLFVDTFAGKAYLGIVPFFMRNIRPRFLPPVPGISNFLELNLRTYVFDRSGTPGIWFYSLDANQPLAVEIARRLFHLPYEHAKMHARKTNEATIQYESIRSSTRSQFRRSYFEYAPEKSLPSPGPDSLPYFLVERYRLYSSTPKGLLRGSVYHKPYPLTLPKVNAWDENLLPMSGFRKTGRPPDHTLLSRGVDVCVYPLEKV